MTGTIVTITRSLGTTFTKRTTAIIRSSKQPAITSSSGGGFIAWTIHGGGRWWCCHDGSHRSSFNGGETGIRTTTVPLVAIVKEFSTGGGSGRDRFHRATDDFEGRCSNLRCDISKDFGFDTEFITIPIRHTIIVLFEILGGGRWDHPKRTHQRTESIIRRFTDHFIQTNQGTTTVIVFPRVRSRSRGTTNAAMLRGWYY
mmetsp:Transcript_14413/g.16136  ORF Transcript_14413/g.16136 Transcript_14413/m.16136 type:complete len:200 (+) Transcript_14413:801-1400(+)